ncbi:sensor domain-containing phosphodiesterase [Frankia nepalensis]|uniref:sensor domain-containing phosphodiesterase n=1 Tax=Frankia nepalensis TaxID=1836974 RepID=UPI0027DC4803|nr:EAL domain-containing protein [Frankia nepalensis]
MGPTSEVDTPSDALLDLLELLRRRLGMEMAWLGRLDQDLLVLQVVCGGLRRYGLQPGSSIRREDGLFGRVLAGELPELIPDTRADPRTAETLSVRELGVGAYAATPVRDADGVLFGLLGCVHGQARPALGPRELRLLRLLADFLTDYVSDLHRMWEVRSRLWRRIHDLIDSGGPEIFFQPIVDLSSTRTVAVEALSRLPGTQEEPGTLFKDAATVGLGPELETTAVHRALAALPRLPTDIRLAINASPSTVSSGLIDVLLETGCPERLAVEITEHEEIDANDSLLDAVTALRARGVLIVIDDIGTGYAGLDLLLHIRPEVIKLDGYIVRGMGTDPAHRAVAAGVTSIAKDLASRVVAEGIETSSDLAAARAAGINYGQGYLLGRPTALPRGSGKSPERRFGNDLGGPMRGAIATDAARKRRSGSEQSPFSGDAQPRKTPSR